MHFSGAYSQGYVVYFSQYSAILEQEQKRQTDPGWELFRDKGIYSACVCKRGRCREVTLFSRLASSGKGVGETHLLQRSFEAFCKESDKHISSLVWEKFLRS